MWRGIDGPAHAELYVELARDPGQREWLYTFVKGEGYRRFERVESVLPPW